MNTLDLLILAIVMSLAATGYAQGFIVGAASLFGLALGGVVGTRVTNGLMEQGAGGAPTSPYAPLIGLAVGLLITLIGALAMQDLGAELRRKVRRYESAAVDRLLGAVLLAAVGLLLSWFAAAAAIGVPQLRPLRPQIIDSRVVSQLNALLPDAEPVLGAIASYDPFPRFDGGRIQTPPPDDRLPRDPEVRNASRSVLRIVGTACGYRITGSGWVRAPGYVVTNAHVVGGQADTAVQLPGQSTVIDADVVAFDSVNDLAILRVDGLSLNPLRPLGQVANGAAGAVLGYPENQGFSATPARYSDERTVRGQDIYGRGKHERRVTSFRGRVRHGNSGGPLVDGDGNVITTVFASTVGSRLAGGYGIPNDIVDRALRQARAVPPDRVVTTGPCVS